MKARDRLFLMIVVAGLLLCAGYLKVVAPERKQAAALVAQVSSAQQALSTAQSSVTAARAAKNQYPAAYASVLDLGKAVPPESNTASLIYQVSRASDSRRVSFDSITAGGAGPAGTPGPAPAAGAGAAGTAASAFTTLPFTFQFSGSFFDLYHLLDRLHRFTAQTTNGNVQVSGRLLTIQGATLTGDQHRLSGTITANAYVMAPPAAPQAGAGGAPTTAPAAAAPPGASSAAPAVIHP
jgi:hypothetical protein